MNKLEATNDREDNGPLPQTSSEQISGPAANHPTQGQSDEMLGIASDPIKHERELDCHPALWRFTVMLPTAKAPT